MYTPGYPAVQSVAKPPSARTAETLILIAFILQVILTLVWIGELLAAAFIGAIAFFVFGAILAVVAVIGILLALFFLYAAWAWSYQRVRAGNYRDRGWTLLLGILGIPFGFVIVGVLYIVAYIKLGDAQNEQQMMAQSGIGGGMPGMGGVPSYAGSPYAPVPTYPVPPAATAPVVGPGPMAGAAAPVPAPAAAAVPPGVPNCPRCQQPATWIPQYNRYYCYRCQQYV